jgi:mannose-1-phosphate guanylyltransferase
MKASTDRTWAVVLAAGDGSRLRPLTRRLYGEGIPKQFAVIEGERSLLQTTLDRLSSRFPQERTVVVVGRPHQALAREQLREYEGVDLVVQPANVGTGPGLLLPLARIRARDPTARVAVFPSDHHVSHPERLLDGVDRAFHSLDRASLALIGVEADRPATDYGWIVPEAGIFPRDAGIWAVRQFVEKPDRPLAEELLRQGALWNAFICVGRLGSFWTEARRHIPRSAERFDIYVDRVGRPGEEALLDRIYSGMTPADFSRDVLQQARGLVVAPVRHAGWSDWGSPRRVFESLRGMAKHRRLLARVERLRKRGTR